MSDPRTSTLHEHTFSAMGTECALHLHGERALIDDVADAAIEEVLRIETAYSRYRDDSLLSAINRVAAVGGSIEVDEETAALLDYAVACHRKSGGLFDITSGILRRAWDFTSPRLPAQEAIDALLPKIGLDRVQWERPRLTFGVAGMELDLGGIGKEYAADRSADVCAAHGVTSGLVDLGGDVRVIGPHPDGTPWTVLLRDPRAHGAALTSVSLERGAIASSGDYERFIEIDGARYCHILDPRTGWPVRALSSVSVVADRCIVAGSFATIAMLHGEHGAAWLSEQGVPYLCVDLHGRRSGTL